VQPFTIVTGIAAPLDEANVDTNQICPSRFNKTAQGDEWARVLLHDRRFNADGTEKSDFVLNRVPYREAQVLVADRNFGCGSSREGAVYGLATFGFRAVIAPSFGDIFVGNCFKNGVLPVVLKPDEVRGLLDYLIANIGAQLTIDLPDQFIKRPDGATLAFSIHPLIKRRLVGGLDEITLTEEYTASIAAFEGRYRDIVPWRYPATAGQVH
jgi:3-isopropylmalate/(R)-2-methylmalate dehydratase small subunit